MIIEKENTILWLIQDNPQITSNHLSGYLKYMVNVGSNENKKKPSARTTICTN
jgi:hypothetical protein